MRGSRKSFAVLFLFAAINLPAQSAPDLRFGGHALGESAESFFSIATMTGSKAITKEYCTALLNDQTATGKNKSFQNSLSNQNVTVLNKSDFVVFDVEGCEKMKEALRGENVNVGARFASELGRGAALFASGKLVGFNLLADSPYSDAVADMEKRFGFPGQKYDVARPGWPNLQETRWEKDGVLGSVFKDPFDDGVTMLIGYLQPPYDSFLRGAPAPEAVWTLEACEATPAAMTRKQVPQGVMHGLIIHRTAPVYPEAAKQNHIEGTVVLNATIDKCGRVSDLKPISGPAELIPAAVSAVKQWLYRPYLVSKQPIEVNTQITVNFRPVPTGQTSRP